MDSGNRYVFRERTPFRLISCASLAAVESAHVLAMSNLFPLRCSDVNLFMIERWTDIVCLR